MELAAILEMVRVAWPLLALIAAGLWVALRFYGDQRWGASIVQEDMVSKKHFDAKMTELQDGLARGDGHLRELEAELRQHADRIIALEVSNRVLWEPVNRGFERVHERLDTIESHVARHDGRIAANEGRQP